MSSFVNGYTPIAVLKSECRGWSVESRSHGTCFRTIPMTISLSLACIHTSDAQWNRPRRAVKDHAGTFMKSGSSSIASRRVAAVGTQQDIHRSSCIVIVVV